MFEATDRFVVLGMTGSGKTHLSKRIQAHYPRVVVFSSLNDDYAKDTGAHVKTWDQFASQMLYLAEERPSAHRVIFHTRRGLSETARKAELSEACSILFDVGSLQAVVEEVQRFVEPGSQPEGLTEVCFEGRHRMLSWILTTQRPVKCSKDLLSQANNRFVGQLDLPLDVRYAAELLRTEEKNIFSLRPREFLWRRTGDPLRLVDNDLRRARILHE